MFETLAVRAKEFLITEYESMRYMLDTTANPKFVRVRRFVDDKESKITLAQIALEKFISEFKELNGLERTYLALDQFTPVMSFLTKLPLTAVSQFEPSLSKKMTQLGYSIDSMFSDVDMDLRILAARIYVHFNFDVLDAMSHEEVEVTS